MSKPRTEAGRALLRDKHWHLHAPLRGCVEPCSAAERILAIEREAAAGSAGADSEPRSEFERGYRLGNRDGYEAGLEQGPRAQSGPSLDVERLITALGNVTGMRWDGKAIAVEYARLAPADPVSCDE